MTGIGRIARSWGRVGLGGHVFVDAQYWRGEQLIGGSIAPSSQTEIDLEKTLVSAGPEAWVAFGREPTFFGRFTLRGLLGNARGLQGELHIATGGFDVRLMGEVAQFTSRVFDSDGIEQPEDDRPNLSVSLAIGFRVPWGEDPRQ